MKCNQKKIIFDQAASECLHKKITSNSGWWFLRYRVHKFLRENSHEHIHASRRMLVRTHFRNFWLGKAFFSRIWHAVDLTQFGNADSKSAPCQAVFCVFPTQNLKTNWPPKLVKMSQLYITAWHTMNIKTSFRCIKTHLSNILKGPLNFTLCVCR